MRYIVSSRFTHKESDNLPEFAGGTLAFTGGPICIQILIPHCILAPMQEVLSLPLSPAKEAPGRGLDMGSRPTQ